MSVSNFRPLAALDCDNKLHLRKWEHSKLTLRGGRLLAFPLAHCRLNVELNLPGFSYEKGSSQPRLGKPRVHEQNQTSTIHSI